MHLQVIRAKIFILDKYIYDCHATTHPIFSPVLDIGSVECDLPQVQMTPHIEARDYIVNHNVHLRSVMLAGITLFISVNFLFDDSGFALDDGLALHMGHFHQLVAFDEGLGSRNILAFDDDGRAGHVQALGVQTKVHIVIAVVKTVSAAVRGHSLRRRNVKRETTNKTQQAIAIESVFFRVQ